MIIVQKDIFEFVLSPVNWSSGRLARIVNIRPYIIDHRTCENYREPALGLAGKAGKEQYQRC